MTPEGEPDGERVWIVGPGRLGLALGLLLHRSGLARSITVSGRRATAPRHPLFEGASPPARYHPGPPRLPAGTSALLLAVPDAAVGDVAAAVAAAGVPPGLAALHLSGALGAEVLAPLAPRASTGSLHPLAAIADPAGGADRLRGIAWAMEGDGAALRLAERIVRAAEGRPLRVAAGAKPLYHAAASLASNFVVALLAEAEAWMVRAGIPAAEARNALAALAAGAVADVAASGPAGALTGPVARGDAAVVRSHLARLSPDERRLYSTLGRRALRLAREGGLTPAHAAELDGILGEER